ncbi:MAG: hypothetical protein ACTHJQ_22840 [Rhizobiaceae bacterium]
MNKLDYEALPPRLQDALIERGHSREAIEAMDTKEAVREYAAWKLGDPGWGDDFYNLVRALDAATVKP